MDYEWIMDGWTGCRQHGSRSFLGKVLMFVKHCRVCVSGWGGVFRFLWDKLREKAALKAVS